MDVSLARLASVEQMLRHRVTVEEALAIVAPLEHPPKPKKRRRSGLPVPAPPRGEGLNALAIRTLAASMQPDDELWLYDSGPEDWARLGGEMGFAVVRDGRVVAFDMRLNN